MCKNHYSQKVIVAWLLPEPLLKLVGLTRLKFQLCSFCEVSYTIHFGSKKHPKFGWASFVEPCWLFHTCCGHQKSFPVCLTNTPLVALHHEGAFKTICLLGCSFMGCGCTIDYCIILFKSVCSPFSPLFSPPLT